MTTARRFNGGKRMEDSRAAKFTATLLILLTIPTLSLLVCACRKEAPAPRRIVVPQTSDQRLNPESRDQTPQTAPDVAAHQTAGATFRGTVVPPGQVAPSDNMFVFVEAGPEFLDPNKISESSGNQIAMNLFEPLLNYARGNSAPTPGVAQRYEVSADGLTYTFYLRNSARWTNHRTVTAHDFVYSWERGLNPATASRNAQLLWYVRGAKAYNQGQSRDFSTVGVRAQDDLTLIVELEAPTPFFPQLVCYIAYAPVPRETIEQHRENWTRPENMVVNGPFRLTEWAPRNRIVMKKNDTYWDAANVRLAGAIAIHTESEDTAFQLYESGAVHWTPAVVPAEKIPLLMRDGRADFHIDPIMCVSYYLLRMDKAPFDNPAVRRAFNMAIDKKRLVDHVLRAGQQPATNLVPPMFEPTTGYKSVPGDDFDPDRAKTLLAEAGYPNGAGLPAIEMVFNTFEGNRLIGELVQRNLKEVLGVEITLINMEWKSLLQTLQRGDFHFGRGGWCADYPDPMTFLEVFDSAGESNYAGYQNREYDALLQQIRASGDINQRNELMRKAETWLNRDVPMVPFYFYTRSYLLKSFVRGFEPQYQDHHLLKYIYFE